MPTAAERLTNLLGSDPTKNNPTTGAFAKALEKIKKEQDEKLAVQVEEQLRKAIDLQCSLHKLKSQFDGQYNKTEKELNKLMNRIEALSQGKEPPKEEEGKEGAPAA